MQGDLTAPDQAKKVGGEAGGTSPPFRPSDGGGRIPPEGNQRERAFDLPPGKSRRRGRLMPATPSISSIMIRSDHDLISSFEHDLRVNALRLARGKTGFRFSGSCSRALDTQPFARGTATKRDDPPLLTRIRTLFLLSVRAAFIASRTSPTLVTLFPATSRITSPSLKPRSAAALLGSTSVTTTPSFPAPATLLAGATVRPSLGTSVPRVGVPPPLSSVSAFASTAFGNWPSVRLTTLSWPLCSTLSFTELPGGMPPMV